MKSLRKSMRRSLATIAGLGVASITTAGLAFLTNILLARYLGPEGFGKYASALAFVSLFAPLAGFGLNGLLLRAFGQEGHGANRWLAPSFQFVKVSTLASLTLYFVTSSVFLKQENVWLTVWLSGVVLHQLAIGLMSSRLRIEARYKALAMWEFSPNLLRLLLVCVFVLAATRFTPVLAAMATGIAGLIVFIAASPSLYRMSIGELMPHGHGADGGSMTSNWGPVRNRDVVCQAWPFGLAGVFYLLFYQSSLVILEKVSGGAAAGALGAALSILAAVYLFPNVVFQKFLLPKIHRWSKHSFFKFRSSYRIGLLGMAVSGVIGMFLTWLLAPLLIPALFGDGFEPTIHLLNIVAICIPIRFISTSVGAFLVTHDHMRRKVRYMGVVAISTLVANVILILAFSSVGAAIATVFSEALLLTLYLRGAKKYVFPRARVK